MPTPASPRILFICTGNICRSPTAQALLAHKAQAAGIVLAVDSAAISDEERGNPIDRRAAVELRRRGVPLPVHAARQIQQADFVQAHWIIGMTQAHCIALHRLAPPTSQARIARMLDFAHGHAGRDVPDPWYGSAQDFVHAFDLIEAGVDGLLAQLSDRPVQA